MPYIHLEDASGFCYQISTGNWWLIREWLKEILPRTQMFTARDSDGVTYNASANIHPMFAGPDGKVPDWLTDSRYVTQQIRLPSYDPDQVIAYLMEWRSNAEQTIRDEKGTTRDHT